MQGLTIPPTTNLPRRDALTGGVATIIAFKRPKPAHSEETVNDNEKNQLVTTPRGLQYIVTKSPDDPNSPTPERGQKVKVSYTLYLNSFPEDSASSVKIDSSKGFLGDRPFGFLAGVSQVIKGWDLAIMEMRVGEERKLVINSDLGYGDKGAGGKIPGKATLYFDVEFIELGPKAKIGPEQVKWLEDNPL